MCFHYRLFTQHRIKILFVLSVWSVLINSFSSYSQDHKLVCVYWTFTVCCVSWRWQVYKLHSGRTGGDSSICSHSILLWQIWQETYFMCVTSNCRIVLCCFCLHSRRWEQNLTRLFWFLISPERSSLFLHLTCFQQVRKFRYSKCVTQVHSLLVWRKIN